MPLDINLRRMGECSNDGIKLPGILGIQCIKKMKPLRTTVKYLMCTVFEDNDKIFDSLCTGATGYILKNTLPEKLYEAITEIYHGGSPMSSLIARKVASSFYSNVASIDTMAELSAREKEVLECVSRRLRYKKISTRLHISPETVHTYIRHIYEKLHVKSRVEALDKVFPKGGLS